MFKCDSCTRQFNSQYAVNQHMDALRHRLPRFNCETCDRAFFSQHAANQHMNDTGHWGPQVKGNSDASFSSEQDWSKQGWVRQDFSEQRPSFGGLFGQNLVSSQSTSGQNTIGQSLSPGARFYCETCNMKFLCQNDADLHREASRHKKPSMIDGTEILTKSHTYTDEIVKLFDDGWRHPTRTANLHYIYVHKQRAQELLEYLKRGEARVLFHGTQRACHVGDPNHALRVCNNTECHLCGILRDGFKLDRAKPNGMFGPGIYTTDVSSKADKWVMNHHMHSKLHVMLLCAVSVGKSEKLYRADRGRKGPSSGYQSVEGAVLAEGGVLQDPEIVLYSENLVVTFGMLVYTREGWQPF